MVNLAAVNKLSLVVCLVEVSLLLSLPGYAQGRSAPHRGPHAVVSPMVVAAEPEAAQAGLDVLKRGGTAVDAAVAIQATLSLVEPQSSGVGGGAFMLYYDAATGKVTAYNGREKAPAAATGRRFLDDKGKPLSFATAVVSGRATGVPGAMFMLEQAQKEHGRLRWDSLFLEPIRLATKGFKLSPRLGKDLHGPEFPQKHTPDFRAYFSDGKGALLRAGDRLKNPAYAQTLRTIARDGMDAFRKGPLAIAIVNKVAEDPLPGGMTMADLRGYQPETADAICKPYRIYIVCEAPPPSGGVPLLQALKILENFPVDAWGRSDPRSWAAFIEASRLMYADRDQYVGDPDFVPVPVDGLLDPRYNASRAATVAIGAPSPVPAYGVPPGAPLFKDDQTIEPGGTTHFVVIDRYGNVVSMTTTVESFFGTGRMVGGFFLNNQLTDFSFSPVTPDGLKSANAVEGNKRPRSAMSPTLVFDRNHRLVAALGSPGGPAIIAYNLKALIGILDWHMSMQDAINLPNVVAKGAAIRVEVNRMDPKIESGLKAMGYHLTEVQGEASGLNGLLRQKDGGFAGGSDPRREGVVLQAK